VAMIDSSREPSADRLPQETEQLALNVLPTSPFAKGGPRFSGSSQPGFALKHAFH